MEEWRSMTKDELELQYSPSRWTTRSLTPDGIINDYISNITEQSKYSREKLKCTLGVPYGRTMKQKLDIFEPSEKSIGGPVFLYIHGGYWQDLSREVSSFIATPLVEEGITFICMGYDLAPHATMEDIVGQVNKAVEYVCAWAKKNGSTRMYLGGHSAGGHLVAMALAKIAKSGNPDLAIIKGAMPMSGVYDLRPLVNTYVNDPLNLTEETAWCDSPLNYIDDIIGVCKRSNMSIKVTVGGEDPPEFRKQSKYFYEALKNAGVSVEFFCIEGEDHFTVNDKMWEKNFVLTQELLKLILK